MQDPVIRRVFAAAAGFALMGIVQHRAPKIERRLNLSIRTKSCRPRAADFRPSVGRLRDDATIADRMDLVPAAMERVVEPFALDQDDIAHSQIFQVLADIRWIARSGRAGPGERA